MIALTMGDWAGLDKDTLWDLIQGSWVDSENVNAARSVFDILAAYEEVDGYEGSAYLLLRKKETGELYEVTSSHCSCDGHYWGEPAPVVKAYVLDQFNGRYPSAPFAARYACDQATVDAFRVFVEAL